MHLLAMMQELALWQETDLVEFALAYNKQFQLACFSVKFPNFNSQGIKNNIGSLSPFYDSIN